MLQRRAFLRSGSLAVFAAGLGGLPSFMATAAAKGKILHPYKRNKTLVCIFQRGAMDGLMTVSPYSDPNLKLLRPNLYMSPTASEGSMFDLDGSFGLHPSLGSLFPYFKEGRLGIVHGVGSPNTTRSHFDAQDYMETGTPFSKITSSGWLNRAVGLMGHDATPFSAVSITGSLPKSMQGDQNALAITNLEQFVIQMKGNPMAQNMTAKSFEQLYDQASSDLLRQSGKESFEAMKMLDMKAVKNYQPSNGAVYPASPLGRSLRQIAMLIKMDVGLEVGFAESGGWDTHVAQGTVNGALARNLRDFGNSIDAFWKDMEGYHDDVTVMTMTEFGRTAHQNGTGGTDHGRASCLFVLGNDVEGGKVHHRIKSLAKEDLEDQRDLPVTTDFREVFTAVAKRHLRINQIKDLFPGWEGEAKGLMSI
jgi:uncharacterized protein (DUF1501 family)